MRSGSVILGRLTVALMMLALGLVLVVVIPQPVEVAVAVTLAVSAVLLAAAVLRPDLAVMRPATGSGPPADERRLRGSFRRQTHPATPGRPMPRAPGALAEAQPS
ncbi:hypothetical protein HQ325_08825 [Rhodococcus sp. BP-349]|uniref:DUF6412 domain-containing protein n=1 Tax=unclassified Rhodococcus (in: high G+C Gram-positive bacteria) TaxID=192944 RepID=UPI001E0EDA1D|nr:MULTISPECIES: DUF6412 domain-containing protein [unclassified Rhodococcus (in: high G+C Gram-positive bacteria)]MBY6538772.1 hypothetical protein [Rhodococcus sp. BP-363]MBY6543109.1 hypothetical protein [Rhodococcus sp. BP-369]MBY6562339.1 hypothetical protein [Rhodococcus sp. BP-370]MBY6576631.1 hypothetical protein [Rhodococcus sp. BP-364]MBY6585932.1 hypothetical protein [Rhodococcus sp. BP-358]